MYPLGHAGIVLLLFAPIGYVLLARKRSANLAPGVTAALLLTLLPDLDVHLSMFVHRGLTHTFLATGCLGAFAALLWVASNREALGTRFERARFGLLVGTVSGIGHLVGDVITPMGVQPFLPWDQTAYTLALVYARDPVANFALFGAGVAVFSASVNLAQLSLPPTGDRSDEAAVDSSVSSDTKVG